MTSALLSGMTSGDMVEGAIGRLDAPEAPSVVAVEEGQVPGVVTPENLDEVVLVESAPRSARRATTSS